MDGLYMSVREQLVFKIIEDFRAGRLSRQEAALKLGCSWRTITRQTKKIRVKGLEGMKHGNYGVEPVNKLSSEIRQIFVSLYRDKYSTFNFLHALEMIKLHEETPESVSYWTFRAWCRQEGLGKVKKRRRSKTHLARERAANEGFMLQMDGSPHRWNGKDVWCLILAIDDATSDIPYAEFFDSETTWGCMEVLQRIVELKGVPDVILTDCAGWSTGSLKRQQFSQFARVCQELGIKLIGTPSAESKGRVERANRTCQDRLVPEFELYGIKSQIDANRYLQQCFLPEWREKWTVAPVSPTTRYKLLPADTDLRDVFCLKFARLVNRDHTVSYESRRYKLKPGRFGNLWKKEVMVHEYRDGTIALFYAGCRLEFEQLKVRLPRVWKRFA